MKNKIDFFIGLTVFIFCCVMGYQIYLIPATAASEFFSAESFPKGVTGALALLSIMLMIRSIYIRDEHASWPARTILIKIALMATWILLYIIGFIFLSEYIYNFEWPRGSGFAVATFIFLCGAQVLTGYRNPWRIALVAGFINALLYVIFVLLFKVPLP